MTLVIIQKFQSFLLKLDGFVLETFAGLESNTHSMKKIDGKDYNTVK